MRDYGCSASANAGKSRWDVGCSYETEISSDKVGVVLSLVVKKEGFDL